MQAMLSTLPGALADLDEDSLLELHGRVRRERDKYLKQYRRQAAASASEAGRRASPPAASDVAVGRRNQARRDSR